MLMNFQENSPSAKLKKMAIEDPKVGEWAFMLAVGRSNAECRKILKERLGIEMGWDSQYSRWRQWWARKMQLDRYHELSTEAATHWAQNASDPTMRAYLIMRMHALADIEDNPQLAMDILKAEQKEEALNLERRRVEALEKVVAMKERKEQKPQVPIPDRADRIESILKGA